MTHFLVAVQAKDQDDLDKRMLPYHEYECTGILEFTELVPIADGDLAAIVEYYTKDGRKISEPKGQDKEFVAHMKEQEGYDYITEKQAFCRRTNPNSKWDWYAVGGRWSEAFPDNPVPLAALHARREENKSRAVGQRDKFKAARLTATASDETLKHAQDWFGRNDELKAYYNGDANALALDLAAFDKAGVHWFSFDDIKDTRLTEEEFLAKVSWEAVVSCFIDQEGKWNERGSVGWWGMMGTENQDNYDGENGVFWSWVKSLPEDATVYMVDAHI